MNEALDGLPDPRDPEAIDYALRTVLWTPILLFLCRLGSRRQIQHRLNTPLVAAYLSRLARQELARVPHGDTVADVLVRLTVEGLAAVRTDLVRQLLHGRKLEKFRLLGTDYLVTLDGTGHLVLGHEPSPFTEGCLTAKLSNGETLYYRPVQREFETLIALQPRNRKPHATEKAHQVIRWVNGIAYGDRTLNILECVETPTDGSKPTRWLWVTDILITPENALSLANEGGRQRWRTENEGFNVQKNGGYAMEHAYAEHPTAARNFYLLLQIAHLFAQLFEAHLGGKKDVTHECGSLRNLAHDLLEALRTDPLPSDEDIEAFLNTPIQVRLGVDSS